MKMSYKILTLLLILFLSSCSIDYDKNTCEEKSIDFLTSDQVSFTNICNYKEKLKNIILKDNILNIEDFYTVSKIDIDSWEYILWNINSKMSDVQKIQLYYILKEIYNYSDEDIENKLWFIEAKYKNLWISTQKVVLAENLLTQVFQWQEDTINGIQNASWNLNYNDLEFLHIIFILEPERFNNINLVSDLIWWYNVLKDEPSKKLYKDIMKYLFNNVHNNQSKEIIGNFLNKINE